MITEDITELNERHAIETELQALDRKVKGLKKQLKRYYSYNFNFQIKVEGKAWHFIPVLSIRMKSEMAALTFARNLADLYNTEIRYTQCPADKATFESGTYILPNNSR